MSIIHNAFKKVQQSMEKDSSPVNPVSAPEEIVEVLPSLSSSKEKKENPLQTILLFVLCMVIIGASGFFIVSQIQSKDPHFMSKMNFNIPLKLPKISLTKPTKPAAKPLAQMAVEQSPAPAAPVTTVSTPPTPAVLNVQGIMASNNHNIVLIDNKIYAEGETVNGIKILTITMDAITIEQDGKQETIVVKK